MTDTGIPPWKKEFSRFSDRSLREMKKYADNTNDVLCLRPIWCI